MKAKSYSLFAESINYLGHVTHHDSLEKQINNRHYSTTSRLSNSEVNRILPWILQLIPPTRPRLLVLGGTAEQVAMKIPANLILVASCRKTTSSGVL